MLGWEGSKAAEQVILNDDYTSYGAVEFALQPEEAG